MDMMEKVKTLREKADISKEEAMNALDAAGGDLLDAMVLLERQGKVKEPGQDVYSTQYEKQEEYVSVREKVEEQESAAPDLGKSIRRFFEVCGRFIRETTFIIKKEEEIFLKIPTIAFLIILLLCWEIAFPAMVVALLFGIRYSFEGAKNAEKANDVLGKAGEFAEDVKRDFKNNFDV